MEWEDLARDLSQQTDTKIVLLVMDGVGGLPAAARASSKRPASRTSTIWPKKLFAACPIRS